MSTYGKSFVYSGSNKLACSQSGKIVSIDYSGTATIGGQVYNTFKLPTRRTGSDSELHDYRQEWMATEFEVPLSSLGLSSYHDIDWDNLSDSDKTCTYSWNRNGSSRPSNWTVEISPFLWSNRIEANTSASDDPNAKAYSILFNGHRYYNSAAIEYIDKTLADSGWRIPGGSDMKGVSLFFFNKNIGGSVITVLNKYIPEFHPLVWGTTLSNKVLEKYYGAGDPGPRLYRPWNGGGYTYFRGSDNYFANAEPTYPRQVELEYMTPGLSTSNSSSRLTKTLDVYSAVGESRFWPIRPESRIPQFDSDGMVEREFSLRLGVSPTSGNIDPTHNNVMVITARYLGKYVPAFYSVRLCRAPLIP